MERQSKMLQMQGLRILRSAAYGAIRRMPVERPFGSAQGREPAERQMMF